LLLDQLMPAPFPPPNVKVLTVGELTRSVKELLETAYAPVWVEGEVSNLSKPNSGHVYLTLKDDAAPLRALIYRAVALRLRFDLRDGMKVIARGRLTVYEPRGEYQLQIEEVQPKGIGPLELAFRQLKEKLSVLGYFEPARKRKPVPFPSRVALLTSPTGSAVRDMLEVLTRRWPAAEVWVCPVRVQGDGAAADIAGALGRLNRIGPPEASSDRRIDVVILGRGGGSLEDLWAFNEEVVAHAIFNSLIPVVSGVGHEDDLTIADLVADIRALTPSEAAERVVPDRSELLAWFGEVDSRMRSVLSRAVKAGRERVAELASRRCLRAPLERIEDEKTRLNDWDERLSRAARQRLARDHDHLASLAGRLEALSPLNVLGRGYSLTRKEDGSIVRDVEQVRPGERFFVDLQRGRLVGRVEECQTSEDSADRLQLEALP
jgi:exodeoxyribonuclease VII large subunit